MRLSSDVVRSTATITRGIVLCILLVGLSALVPSGVFGSPGEHVASITESLAPFQQGFTARSVMATGESPQQADALHLTRVAFGPEGSAGTVSIVWERDASGWFGVSWKMTLRADRGLLPLGLPESGSGNAFVGPDSSDTVNLDLLKTPPSPHSVYETIIAYDPATHALSLAVIDKNTGNALYRGGFAMADDAPDPTSVTAQVVSPEGDDRFTDATVTSLAIEPVYVPVGFRWDVAVQPRQGAPIPGWRIGRGEDLIITLALSTPPPPGHFAVVLETANSTLELIDVPSLDEARRWHFPGDDFPALIGKLKLAYVVDGVTFLLDETPFEVGEMNVRLTGVAWHGEAGLLTGAVDVVGTHRTDGEPLNVTIDFHALQWDSTQQRYLKYPTGETIVIRDIGLPHPEEAVTFPFQTSLPPREGPWEIRVSAETAGDVHTTVSVPRWSGDTYVFWTELTTTVTSPDMLADGRFPIGLWWPPPLHETTVARYREIAEAGFTFVFARSGLDNVAGSQQMLQAAKANDVYAVVVDSRFQPGIRWSFDDHVRAIVTALNDYDMPSLAGFTLWDEPHADMFDDLAVLTSVINDVAPGALAYVNLFPSYVHSRATLRTANYDEYVRRFVDEVKPAVLSFDHYPLLESGRTITLDYFENWSIIRKHALRANIPSWVFIQSVDYVNHRRPTEAEMLWQVNVSLAYGAKGILYFTYWTPEGTSVETGGEGFGMALLTEEGEKTDLYDAARRINAELAAVGKELLPLVSESVVHAGERLAAQLRVETFKPTAWVADVAGDPVILGQFQSTDDDHRRRWLLVVNRSFHESAEARLTFADEVTQVAVFDAERRAYDFIDNGTSINLTQSDDTHIDGTLVDSNPTEQVTLWLQPGEARLFLIEK